MQLREPLQIGCGDGYSKRDDIDSCGSHCQNGTYQLGVAMATARERAAATAAAGVAAARILAVLSCDSSSLLFLWEVSKIFVKTCQFNIFSWAAIQRRGSILAWTVILSVYGADFLR